MKNPSNLCVICNQPSATKVHDGCIRRRERRERRTAVATAQKQIQAQEKAEQKASQNG